MKERIAVFSDTHGNRAAVLGALPILRALKPTRIVFLGDGKGDMRILASQWRECPPIEEVCGNVDADSGDIARVIEYGGVRVFMTHGHRYRAKDGTALLVYAALEEECAVALYGHTHVPQIERIDGILLVNPGSLGRPFSSPSSFALLTVEDGKVDAYLMHI